MIISLTAAVPPPAAIRGIPATKYIVLAISFCGINGITPANEAKQKRLTQIKPPKSNPPPIEPNSFATPIIIKQDNVIKIIQTPIE